MSLKTGTLSISDLLATKFTSPAEFGMDTINEVLQADLANHNAMMTVALADLVDITTDRQRIQGTSQTGEMIEADEFSRAPTQKEVPGQTVGFPLRRYQYAIGWTRDYMKRKKVADMAIAQITAERAHVRRVIGELKRALFTPTNRTAVDYLVDNISFPVKALVNGDGAGIQDGPNAEQFNGATHSHYLGTASLTTAGLDALIQTVIEHGNGQDVRVYIARADEAAFRALSGFVAFVDSAIVLPDTSTRPSDNQPNLDVSRLDNRAIGRYNGATIWVKPWMIQGYAFCFAAGSPLKPFAFRQDAAESLQGLYIAGENDAFPLYAQYMQVEFGIGAWNRTNGAVWQFTNATYTAPTITI